MQPSEFSQGKENFHRSSPDFTMRLPRVKSPKSLPFVSQFLETWASGKRNYVVCLQWWHWAWSNYQASAVLRAVLKGSLQGRVSGSILTLRPTRGTTQKQPSRQHSRWLLQWVERSQSSPLAILPAEEVERDCSKENVWPKRSICLGRIFYSLLWFGQACSEQPEAGKGPQQQARLIRLTVTNQTGSVLTNAWLPSNCPM